MKRTLAIEFPWPPKGLSPNARLTSFAKASLFKKTKMQAYLLTRAAAAKTRHRIAVDEGGLLNLTLVCEPPVLRYRDEDNLVANCKAHFDGIAQAVGIDDHLFHFREQEWHKPKKPGKLTVILDWEETTNA